MIGTVLRLILYTVLLVLFITFGPSGLFLDIEPVALNFPLPKSFSGALAPNHILSTAEKLFVDQIEGPESIAEYNGNVFTGCEDGYIYQVNGEKARAVIKVIEKKCVDVWNSSSCGRPLGLKFDSKGTLYVTEPSNGIYTVHDILTKTPKVTQVMDIKQTASTGKVAKFLDDVAVDESGGLNGGPVIYTSDISSEYDLTEASLIFGQPLTGRVLKYDVNANKVETLIDGLLCPNGLELTDDRNAIIIAETLARRIFKHYIRGPKAGQTTIILAEMAGEPDNIRRSATKRESYWVGLGSARNESNPSDLDTLMKYPRVRKFIFRLMHLIGGTIEMIGNIFGANSFRELGFNIRTGRSLMMASFGKGYGMIVEIDGDGNLLRSLQSPDGSVTALSEAKEVRINERETALYLGSFANKYVGKLILKDRV